MAEGGSKFIRSTMIDDFNETVFFRHNWANAQMNSQMNSENMHKSSTRSKQREFYHGGEEMGMKSSTLTPS